MAEHKLIEISDLRQRLKYRESDGRLFWKTVPLSAFDDTRWASRELNCSRWNIKYSGREAFTADDLGYRVGKIMGVKYRAHRVAWAIVNGQWPDGILDHINRVRSDNRMENLRIVSALENANNRTPPEKFSYNACGVYRYERYWRSEISMAGKSVKLGHFKTKDEAIAARSAAEKVLSRHPITSAAFALRPEPTKG